MGSMVSLLHDSLLVHFSEGSGTNLGKVRNRIVSWLDFVKMVSKPTRTAEKRRAFEKMDKDARDTLKAVDGYIMAAPVEKDRRRRKAMLDRDILSLDIDAPTKALLTQIEFEVTPLSGYEFVCHSTRSHTADVPKIRIFAPLKRSITADEFIALSRIMAMILEGKAPMTMTDPVSFRVAQMMFKPTTSIDGDFFFHRNKGALIDPDRIFRWFEVNHGDWRNIANLPLCEKEHGLRRTAAKAQNPIEKAGPVGDFCRAYDVPAAIEKFLPEVYQPVDDWSAKPRYTYMQGTSTSGAVLEDDGLFLYSHHGSDPCADMLVNAFDLVRIHLFGHEDEDAEKDTPAGKMPSFQSMLALLAEDPEYRKSQAESRYDISAMFNDVVDEEEDDDSEDDEESDDDLLGFGDDPVRPAKSAPGPGNPDVAVTRKVKKRKPPKDWFSDVAVDKAGNIQPNGANASIIVYNDPRLFDCLAFNDFTKQIVLRHPIRSKLDIAPAIECRDPINGDHWQDINDMTVRAILEAQAGKGKLGYSMRPTDRDINMAVNLAARRNTFHPVREHWTVCADLWDGVERIDTIGIDYLGVPDEPYYREAMRCMMIASVARIFEPGCKFDFAIILEGATGIRKSSFIKALYRSEWFGELDTDLSNKQQVAETIGGKAVVELSELAGLHKTEHNATKVFMRKQHDDVRMAYDRRSSEFPRQCVVWGSTNDRKYLRDPNGNRSFWPYFVRVETIDTDAVIAIRDQLWGEAVHAYRAMRAAQPVGDLPLYLRDPDSQKTALRLQDAARTEDLHEIWAERIDEWLEQPITIRQFKSELGLPSDAHFSEEEPADTLVLRVAFHREQAAEFALLRDRGIGDYQAAVNIGRALPLLKGWEQPDGTEVEGGHRLRVQGVRRRWYVRKGATAAEIVLGYRSVEPDPDDLI